MGNKVILDFCLWGFDDITPDEISAMLGIQPTKIYIKGKVANSSLTLVAKENGWRKNAGLEEFASFEDQMNALINIIESKAEIFKLLCDKYKSEFSYAIFLNNQEESTPSIHLDQRYNNLIKILNSEFNIDLYNFV